MSITVENLGNLSITMMVEQAIDFRDNDRLHFSDLGDRYWPWQHKSSSGSSA
jgi:hypothetical protein